MDEPIKDDEQPANMSSEQIADMLDAVTDEEEQSEVLEAKKEEVTKKLSEEQQKEAEKKAKIKASMPMANQGVDFAAQLAESRWPCLHFDESTKKPIAKSSAAVLAKYDCKLPPWLEPYWEELCLGYFLGIVIATSYTKIQAQKKIDAEKVVNPEDDADGTESEQSSSQ